MISSLPLFPFEVKMKKVSLLAIMLTCLIAGWAQTDDRPVTRAVAITFDDLPSSPHLDLEALHEMTAKLLASIKSNRVPAMGFVNEGKLNGAAERTAMLKLWVDAGLELGNHTYSHLYFYKTPLERFKEDVIRGEPITRRLLTEKGMKLRYFRHPMLSTGPSLDVKRAFEQFLTERDYIIAPVTIDNSEWLFAEIYAKAKAKGDTALMRRVADAYVPYLEDMFAFYEKLSNETLGYEIKQVLLLHANQLNADYFNQVVQMLKRRGYSFISLDEALKDRAYSSTDNYIGPVGISWLQRWAITKGGKMRPEPGLPAVMKEFDRATASGSDFKTGQSGGKNQ